MNFHADSFENSISAGRISTEKIQEIVDAVDDPRLENPAGDYFHIELADETVEIPKQEKIGIKKDDGTIAVVPTESHIKKLLAENSLDE